MPGKKKTNPSADAEIVREALATINDGPSNRPLRERVRDFLPAYQAFRRLCVSLAEPEIDESAAKGRLLEYFQAHPHQLIDGLELDLIGGISEWARRVRELRKEEGWQIYSGVTFKELAETEEGSLAELQQELGFDPLSARPNQYILVSEDQDLDAKERWSLANDLRKEVRKGLAVREGILRYLTANMGKPVHGEELRYIANDKKEWARRVRELRTQDGFPVLTKMQGRVDLPVGVYVLESGRRFEAHDRNISDSTRVEVLERDKFACRRCGWTRDRANPDDPRRTLELHHLKHHAAGGSNDAPNLVTLCNVDHDKVHALKLDDAQTLEWLTQY